MICFPTAKINLGLRVLEKRTDGYHNIETLFYPIGLKDALEAVPGNKSADFSLTVSGSEEYIDQEVNLVTKAYRLLQKNHQLKPLNTFLHKGIPSGAGLGGGSSDAAFMLKLMNDTQYLQLSLDTLMQLAAQLGADCPFFLTNKPVYATGTGNVFETTPVSLAGYYLVVVKPKLSVSSAAAYAAIKPTVPEKSLREIACLPVTDWKRWMTNDFEAFAFGTHPTIGTIKQRLYKEGAVYASMSGSGSAVYGIFDKSVDLHRVFSPYFYWSELLY